VKIIDVSIRRPRSVIVGVLLAVIFGTMALRSMPVQMRPTIDRPTISVDVSYRGVAPQEMEEQVTTPIEERLNTAQELYRITSRSSTGRSRIELEFDWGVNKDLASIDVLKKLNRVRNLPRDIETPTITAASSDERSISFLAVKSKTVDTNTLRNITEDMIAPRIERVNGVGRVWVYGGQEREIQVVLDYAAMTSRGVSLDQIRRAIGNENRNARGGYIDEGKRRIMVRTLGQFERLEDIKKVILSQRAGGPIYLGDIAEVVDGHKEARWHAKERGSPCVLMGIVKRSGANTVEVMAGADVALAQLNEELAYRNVEIVKITDETEYIWDSIEQVVSNLQIGGLLACVVLLLFLRSFISTAIISFAIPVSLVASFIFLHTTGSTLNIITLAGLAFAVGMVVDNAIVVLESIFRHSEMGKERGRAAFDGAEQVWGAILASTLTTLAVFLPIVFVKEEVGQFFRDIAYSISYAILMSLTVSITVIPMLASKWLRTRGKGMGERSRVLDILTFGWVGRLIGRSFIGAVRWLIRGVLRKIVFVAAVLAVFVYSLGLLPSAEYLPVGSMNTIRASVRLPPGTNMEKAGYLMDQVEGRFLSLPEVDRMLVMAGSTGGRAYIRCKDEYKSQVKAMVAKLSHQVRDIPGIRIRVSQLGIFTRRGQSSGKSIDMRVKGKDLQEVQKYVDVLEEQLPRVTGVIDAQSSLDVSNPEFQIRIDRERAAELGLSVRTVSDAVETLVGGKVASLYRSGGEEIDITLRGPERGFRNVDDLRAILVHTPTGEPVRLGDLIRVQDGMGPTQIEHWNLDRIIPVTVRLAEGIPLETVLEDIRTHVVVPLMKTMPIGYTIELGETADQLRRTKEALAGSFGLAIVIIYLLMSSLFESFRYPLIIMFSVPLAMTGAILGIKVAGADFNVITMLGFIILSGVVVNNAILLVHQALRLLREEGHAYNDAILGSCQTRIRPIFMSTTTSVLAMMPLAAGRGAGSELYSGLGAAIVGGLMVSTLFTLILVPVLFSLFNDVSAGVRRLLRRPPGEDGRGPVTADAASTPAPSPGMVAGS